MINRPKPTIPLTPNEQPAPTATYIATIALNVTFNFIY